MGLRAERRNSFKVWKKGPNQISETSLTRSTYNIVAPCCTPVQQIYPQWYWHWWYERTLCSFTYYVQHRKHLKVVVFSWKHRISSMTLSGCSIMYTQAWQVPHPPKVRIEFLWLLPSKVEIFFNHQNSKSGNVHIYKKAFWTFLHKRWHFLLFKHNSQKYRINDRIRKCWAKRVWNIF